MTIKSEFIQFFGSFTPFENNHQNFLRTKTINGLFLLVNADNSNNELINPQFFKKAKQYENIYLCDDYLEVYKKENYGEYGAIDCLTLFNFDDDMKIKHDRTLIVEMLLINTSDDLEERVLNICNIIQFENKGQTLFFKEEARKNGKRERKGAEN